LGFIIWLEIQTFSRIGCDVREIMYGVVGMGHLLCNSLGEDVMDVFKAVEHDINIVRKKNEVNYAYKPRKVQFD